MVEKKSNQLKVAILIYGYDIFNTDETTKLIREKISQLKLNFSGPLPLPTKKKVVTVLISPHKHKDSQEQFIRELHRRLICVFNPPPSSLQTLDKLLTSSTTKVEIKEILPD